jgi:hypothetical protein
MKDLNTNELFKFSIDLYKTQNYGYSLLVIHGISFGVKIGKQLDLKWSDIMFKNGKPKSEVCIDGRIISINDSCKDMNVKIFSKGRFSLNDYVYKTKRDTRLKTDNLSKELKRKALELYYIDYPTLTSSSMERAWALSIVESNNYSKQSFTTLCEYMGKRTIKETIAFLGCEPIKPKNNIIRYDYIDDLFLSLEL